MATQDVSENAGHIAHRRPASWSHYWPESQYAPDDRRTLLIRDLQAFFSTPPGFLLLSSARSWHSLITLPLDFTKLLHLSGIHDLKEAVHHAPMDALSCLGAAAYEALFVSNRHHLPPAIQAPAKVMVRLHNHPGSFLPVSAVRADQVNRLVTLRGTVTRATPVRGLVTSMQFVCAKCGSPKGVEFPDGRYTIPATCGADGCRSRTLVANRAVAECIDWQRVQLQGLPKDERGAEGRIPRPIDVELLRDLVERCAPGDVITVTGIVKAISGEPASGKRFGDAKRQCLFLPYVEAVSIICNASGGNATSDANNKDGSAQTLVAEPEGPSYLPPNMPGFTQLDLDFIRTFTTSCEGDQLRQLVHSLAPGICGMEMVKAGLVLALFGGVRKGAETDALTSNNAAGRELDQGVPVRGDIHVLLVGDPGLGKSQLLQAAAAAAPRGIYVCGSSTTSAGLTVSVTRDNGEFCFDAGALVLADRGVCCIDEFDKATGEHAAMLGAMEQQEVAVAKAGLVATLPARAAVLAAANPVDGQYNRGKTLLGNLKLSPAMLSRFDVAFLLLDRPDPERDQRLTAAVMAAHSDLAGRTAAARMGSLEAGAAVAPPPLLLMDGKNSAHGGRMDDNAARISLKSRLGQRKPDDEPLPTQLLRKYIAYARQYVHPILSQEAASVIKLFYLDMRQRSAGDVGAPPVTARQLESLVRLAEARARVDLRETVTAEDAYDAVEIMQEAQDGMTGDGIGVLDFRTDDGGRRGGGGRGAFQGERQRYLEALRRYCQNKASTEVGMGELFSLADRIELAVPDTSAFIEHLNELGDILKRGGGAYALNAPLQPRDNRMR